MTNTGQGILALNSLRYVLQAKKLFQENVHTSYYHLILEHVSIDNYASPLSVTPPLDPTHLHHHHRGIHSLDGPGGRGFGGEACLHQLLPQGLDLLLHHLQTVGVAVTVHHRPVTDVACLKEI